MNFQHRPPCFPLNKKKNKMFLKIQELFSFSYCSAGAISAIFSLLPPLYCVSVCWALPLSWAGPTQQLTSHKQWVQVLDCSFNITSARLWLCAPHNSISTIYQFCDNSERPSSMISFFWTHDYNLTLFQLKGSSIMYKGICFTTASMLHHWNC